DRGLDEAPLHEQAIEDAEVGVENPLPRHTRDHDGHEPWDERGDAEESLTADLGVQQQRGTEPDHELAEHRPDGPHRRVRGRGAEVRVGDDLVEVVQPGESAHIGVHQMRVTERIDEHHHKRVADEADDEDPRRQQRQRHESLVGCLSRDGSDPHPCSSFLPLGAYSAEFAADSSIAELMASPSQVAASSGESPSCNTIARESCISCVTCPIAIGGNTIPVSSSALKSLLHLLSLVAAGRAERSMKPAFCHSSLANSRASAFAPSTLSDPAITNIGFDSRYVAGSPPSGCGIGCTLTSPIV